MVLNTSVGRRVLVAFAIAACVIAAGSVGRAQRGGGGPAGPQVTQSVPELRFRYVGPQSAGRVASVAGVPGDPTTYYLGAASGGVWKSTDSGQSWEPIFDSMPVQAIGSLAVAPSDPNQVWAGTGEAWVIRDSDIGGDGIYKSTDAGKTWKNVGLPDAGRIGRIIVHPTNPEHRLRVRHRARHRAAAGARRVPHAGRRRDVGEIALRRSEHGLFGHLDGSESSGRAGRRHVAGRAAHVGDVQRRAGQRRVPHARRRQDVDESRRPACRARRSARSTSRSRRRIRSGCTR